MSTKLDRAWAAVSLRRWDVALAELTAALADDPEDATAHALRAEVLYRQEKYINAQLAAQDAIGAAPDYGWGYYWLSWSQLSAGPAEGTVLKQARQGAEEALRCDPAEPAYWALLAQIALSAGEYEQAAEHAQVGLTHDPDHESCLQALVAAQKARGATHQKRQTLFKLLEVNPESLFAHRQLATDALAAGNALNAFQHARAAVQLDPSDGDARNVYQEATRRQHPWIRALLWTSDLWQRCKYLLPVIAALPLVALIFIRGNPKFANDDTWFWISFCFFIVVCCYGLLSIVLVEFIAAHSRRLRPMLPEAASIRRTFYLVGAILGLFAVSIGIAAWWDSVMPVVVYIDVATLAFLVLELRKAVQTKQKARLTCLGVLTMTATVMAICTNCQPQPVVWFAVNGAGSFLVIAAALKATRPEGA